MSDVRKLSTPWHCAECEREDFGAQIADGDDAWTLLPSGWWMLPIDHGDTDGEEGKTVMLHAFCGESCVRDAIARKHGEPKPSLGRPAPDVVRGVVRGRLSPRPPDPPSPPPRPSQSATAISRGPLGATIGERLRSK